MEDRFTDTNSDSYCFSHSKWGCSAIVSGISPFGRLGAAWDLLMRGEGIELPREQALMEPQREMTCLGCAKNQTAGKESKQKKHAHIFRI